MCNSFCTVFSIWNESDSAKVLMPETTFRFKGKRYCFNIFV